jgi:hypothetical protein
MENMKIPKTVCLCGKLFKIEKDPTSGGGWFRCDTQTISVGTKFPERIPEIFLHEIIETIFALRDMRYYQNTTRENGDLLFNFNHKEFTAAILDISCALGEIKFGGKQ